MSECQPTNCPWNAEEWKRLGRMEEKLDTVIEGQKQLTDRVDALNHVRARATKHGATSGAAGGGIVSVVIVGVYAWAKSKWQWLPLVFVALTLSGCATPRLSIKADAIEESGPQLLWGERHYQVATPTGAAVVDVDKRTLGIVGGALGGAAIGAAAGNPATGAVVGTIAGGLAQALDRDRATTPTVIVIPGGAK